MPKKKSSKKPLPTPEYDSKRETRVLLEEINKSVKTVAEQHGSIITKLEEHDRRFDRLEEIVTENRKNIKELQSGQKELQTGQKDLQAGQKEIKEKLEVVTENHEKRIQKLEVIR